MRKWLGNLLIIIFTIVLTINVFRAFFYENHLAPVDTFTVLDAISEFKVDTTPLYNDLVEGSSIMSSAAKHWTDAFKFSTYESGKTVLTSINRFFTCIASSFEDMWYFIANFVFLIYDVFKFIFDFFSALFTFMNKVIGTVFNTYGTEYKPKGYSGGGFGGRR